MKFATNHHYRFDRPLIAFLAGFFQATSIFAIELVNLTVILSASTYLEVVMNFMALAIIAEFDDKFYDALGEDELKDLIENPAFDHLYTVTRTSSRDCSEANKLEDDIYNLVYGQSDQLNDPVKGADNGTGPGLTMKVSYLELGWIGVFLRAIYKVMRVVQVTLWFYFLPFLVLLGSYFVPHYYQVTGRATVT